MLESFRKELLQTGYIHSPLPLHPECSLKAEREKEEVLAHQIIWDGTPDVLESMPQAMPLKYGIGVMEKVDGMGRNGGTVQKRYDLSIRNQ